MSIRNLDALFEPEAVALIGASNRPASVGYVTMRNLLNGGFSGPVMPVNPTRQAVAGVLTYPDIASLPVTPDLAVIATPPPTVPGLIEELGQRGSRGAVVLTAGLTREKLDDGRTLQQAMLDNARKYGVRILGPNCLGMIVPGVGLNASFAHINALPGKIAFVSQSGGLATAVLDYATSTGIGFSCFLSLGDIVDIDFGDVLDYLGSDPSTTAIVLYIEAIKEARQFMSAARAAARNKPVVVIKAGRVAEGAKAAASHTGAMAGSDDVYHAAFRRAGMLRVFTIAELFDSVQTLGQSRPLRGDRLAILTNGGGPGVIATDALIEHGGQLAEISEEGIKKLDELMPPTWSRGNPVDIIGDANGQRYADAMNVLLNDSGVDAVLVMHVPTAVADVNEVARGVIKAATKTNRNVLTSWLGRDTVQSARDMFAEAGLPSYSTPDRAVRGFMHMVRYQRNQELLMETPASQPEEFTPATATARLVIQSAMATGRDILSEAEAKGVLAAYGIPVVETHIAATPADAERLAGDLGFPVALKVLSPQISHKSDVGGVVLNLGNGNQVRESAEQIIRRVNELRPDATVTGFTVQAMARMPGAHELIIGVTTDAIFGPAILFGEGGKAVEVIKDGAVGLPPLNMSLARALIMQTRISNLLLGYRDEPAADIDAICLTLIQISQLITDLPEVAELDINPLFANKDGVLALDARLRVVPATTSGTERLAIRPYPKELEEKLQLRDGRPIVIRPIRPEDEPEHAAFLDQLAPEDIRFRFFGLVRDFPHSQLARFTQIDYDREMAFIASGLDDRARKETLGVVRAVLDPDLGRAEFAIVVRSDMKNQGLGSSMMNKMIAYLRRRGVPQMVGQVLPDNTAMLALAKSLGFQHKTIDDGDAVEVWLPLAT